MGYELVADSRASGGAPEHGDMAVAFDFDECNIALGIASDEVGVCGVAARAGDHDGHGVNGEAPGGEGVAALGHKEARAACLVGRYSQQG